MQATKAVTAAVSLDEIRAPVQADFDAVNRLITDELFSDVPLIQEVAKHIVSSGGKRLRPLLVLLSAKACGYVGDEQHELATVIEFIHTATLLHDDVVDKTDLRRGEQTANELWGNSASILVGDFLYSRSFQILAKRANVTVTKVLADSTNIISEGEVLQLIHQHDTDLSKEHYLRVIERKTAELFQAACQIGAIIGQQNNNQLQINMRQFGHDFGVAYQIIDDVLDYMADPDVSGKAIGNDLREGKITLPLLRTLETCDETTKQLIHQVINNGATEEQLESLVTAVKQSDAYTYCVNEANRYIDNALEHLDALPQSECKQSLVNLCQFVLERHY